MLKKYFSPTTTEVMVKCTTVLCGSEPKAPTPTEPTTPLAPARKRYV